MKTLRSFPDSSDETDGILAEINITPLTDIFLVLLIIFMVTSSALSQLGAEVDLPQAQSVAAPSEPAGVVLTLLPDGSMKINDARIASGDWATIEVRLKEAFRKTRSRLVVLEGDRKAFLGSAIELMDHAKRVGATKFAIATKEK